MTPGFEPSSKTPAQKFSSIRLSNLHTASLMKIPTANPQVATESLGYAREQDSPLLGRGGDVAATEDKWHEESTPGMGKWSRGHGRDHSGQDGQWHPSEISRKGKAAGTVRTKA